MNKHYLLGMLLTLALLTLPATTVYSQPSWHSNTATIETPDLVVRFFNKQPQYMFWIPRENGTSVYIVKFLEIVEFDDLDGDGAYTSGDLMLARAQLLESSIQWNIASEEIVNNGILEIRITMNATVKVIRIAEGPGGIIGYVNVSFVNHIYNQTISVDGYEVEGNKELKIDIVIENWPWVRDDSKLAIGIIFAGHFRGKEGVPKMEEHAVREHEREIKMSHEDAPYQGVFRYRDQVKIMENNTSKFGQVNESDMSTSHRAIRYLAYPHFEGVLIHDPSITVEKSEEGLLTALTSNYLYIGVIAIVLLAVIVIAVKKR